MISTIITFLLVAKCSWCLPLDQLYPFGPNANDRVLDTNDPGPAAGLTAAFYFDAPEVRQDFNSAQLREDLYVSFNTSYIAIDIDTVADIRCFTPRVFASEGIRHGEQTGFPLASLYSPYDIQCPE